jgi:hypothetical protein
LREVHVEDARLMSVDDAGEPAHGAPAGPTEPRELGKRDIWKLQEAPDSALRFLLEAHNAAPAVLAELEGQFARESLNTANANWPQVVEG